MEKILIITGPNGDAHGWGDLNVTKTLCDALCTIGKPAEIAYVESKDDFNRAIENKSYDIVWCGLYHISNKEDMIGLSVSEDAWLADKFDSCGIPYIGPNALTIKKLLNKAETQKILQKAGVAVPENHMIKVDEPIPSITFPAFVKPCYESRSIGIDDDSVVENTDKLIDRIKYIHKKFEQPALVEEYLPGQEYTVLMIGNGERQEYLPGMVTLNGSYGRYPILRSDMRGVGLTKIIKPNCLVNESIQLCKQAVAIMNCLDHVRVDMRLDKEGQLRIIEINGIPGLKPLKSWSPQIYSIYHASPEGPMQDYRNMVNLIVDAAIERYGIS